MLQSISSLFKFKKRKTSIKKEIIAGVITFCAMFYILPVNSNILHNNGNGIPYGGVFIATAIASAIGSIAIGLFSNIPIAIAPGMGSNIFFVNTMMNKFGLSWEISLSIVILNGFLFLIFSIMGIIDKFIKSMPKSIKNAFVFGLGLYLAYIGLKNSGIVNIENESLNLGNLKNVAILLTIIGMLLIFILNVLKIKSSILVTLLTMSILGLVIGQIMGDNKGSLNSFTDIKWNYSNFKSFKTVFGKGIINIPNALTNVKSYIAIIALIFMTLSGSSGSLISIGEMANLENEKGEIKGFKKGLISIGLSSTVAGILGTSSTGGYLESNAGVSYGARTGFSSVVVGLLFIISIPLIPILKPLFNHQFVTSPILIMVGSMMAIKAKDIMWENKIIGISSFILIIIMIFTSSILNGMAFGIIFYVLLNIVTKNYKKINIYIYIFSFLFLAYLISMPFII